VVECDLAKVEVAGSNPVSRSIVTRVFQKSVKHLNNNGVTRFKEPPVHVPTVNPQERTLQPAPVSDARCFPAT
jgi:hypothetical protein